MSIPDATVMVATDLDGTLLDSHSRLDGRNRATLHALGQVNAIRVVATGRSLYSARRVLPPDFPIDYLVFASGAGIIEWQTGALLAAHHLARDHARQASEVLMARELDFMLHEAVPDSHYFYAHRAGPDNDDFERRIARYAPFARDWSRAFECGGLSQLLAVEPVREQSQYQAVVEDLADLKVIRTTSPLDGRSCWIEIFPRAVSKALACEWVAERHALAAMDCIAVGNDFNDVDLLDWAGKAFVVANAPAPLRTRYRTVASNDGSGFSEAVQLGKGQRTEHRGQKRRR